METVVLDSAQCKKHPEAASKVCVIVRRSDLRCEKELHLAVEHWSPTGLEKSPNLWSFFFSEYIPNWQ